MNPAAGDTARPRTRSRFRRLASDQEVSSAPATLSEWEAAWLADPSGTYHQSPAWSQLWVSLTPDTELAPVRLRLNSGVDVIVPLLTQRSYRGLVSTHLSNPSGSQTGWLAANALSDTEARQVVRHVVARFRDLNWLTTPLQHRDCLPPPARVDYSRVVDLRGGPEAVRSAWSKGHKSAYKQGIKAGVEVRITDSAEDCQRFSDLHLQSVRRWQAAGTPVTSSYDAAWFRTLRSAPGVDLWAAERGGELLSGAVILNAPRGLTYCHGASDEAAFSLRPVNVLLGEILMRAATIGKEWADLGASGGHASVDDFKRRFGAVAAPYGAFSHVSARTRALRAIRQGPQYRRVAGSADEVREPCPTTRPAHVRALPGYRKWLACHHRAWGYRFAARSPTCCLAME